ncbi:MAG: L-lactate dehydrogenase [Desulfobacterales bacterium]|nr:L-lactate dehydrogenase [Desulfobacterales bacterium]
MKIGIVGSGMVGSTAAYAMLMGGIGREIVLVDINEKRSKAEAQDLSHAVPFAHPLTLRTGGYSDLKGSRMIIISAGVSQKPGESRLDLLKRNADVFKKVIPRILQEAPQAILVVATNPLDIMTHLTARYASDFGVPPTRVLGTGTMLDTARFRSLLGLNLGIDPQHIHAYVVGEHGDSEVLIWSQVRIGAISFNDFCITENICHDEGFRQEIDSKVRNAAYTIIEGKGATYYGIGSALSKIADVVLSDQRSILTVSTPASEVAGVLDVSVSLPRLVGGDGILTTFNLPMSEAEKNALRKSAQIVRNAIEELSEV